MAEIEVNYGVDPTPVIATNAFITTNQSIEYLFEAKERTSVTTGLLKTAGIQVGQGVKISFSTELKGGVANLGDAPKLDPLLLACGLKGTADAGVSYLYEPETDPHANDSVTLWYQQDAILHKASGCRGNFKISLTPGNIAMIDFEFTGLYSGTIAADSAFPTLASIGYSAVAPIVWNTASFTFNSIACTIAKFEFDLGNSVTKRIDANAASGVGAYIISGRETKGAFDPEATALSTFNPWTDFSAQTARAIVCMVGTVAKSIIQIDVFRCVLEQPKYADRDNILTHDIAWKAVSLLTSVDDDIRLTFK